MAKQGEAITAQEFNELKAMVKAEMQRRGKSEGHDPGESVGSMAAYAGTDYDYNTAPARGVKIAHEHIRKIAEPLDAVRGTKDLTPAEGDAVKADDMNRALTALEALTAVDAGAYPAGKTGCGAACSGLCATGCNTGCDGYCADNCAHSCDGYCSGNCGGDCEGSCLDTCEGICGTFQQQLIWW